VVYYVITDARILLKKYGKEERKKDTDKTLGHV
jgi:hypothetical protein